MSANDQEHLKIFAASAGEHLAREMCDHLDMSLGKGRAIQFPDGEIIVKLEDDVRGRDCYVVQSTCEPVNDNLMELLIWIDCLRRASARRITAVIPYFGYARQDRKDEGRVPITAKLVANLVAHANAGLLECADVVAETYERKTTSLTASDAACALVRCLSLTRDGADAAAHKHAAPEERDPDDRGPPGHDDDHGEKPQEMGSSRPGEAG